LQTFDHEKYKFIQLPEAEQQQQQQQHKQHNNNNNNNSSRNSRSMNKTSLSLAGLRIDERGGIYLNPLLDSNSAYFKCYVAEELNSGELIGYILFFNTLDDRGSMNGSSSAGGGTAAAGHDDPVAVIEDLFVKPKYRSRGIATQLWRKVLKVSQSVFALGSTKEGKGGGGRFILQKTLCTMGWSFVVVVIVNKVCYLFPGGDISADSRWSSTHRAHLQLILAV
jgi:GNAT superfamily N-acetyltransferase